MELITILIVGCTIGWFSRLIFGYYLDIKPLKEEIKILKKNYEIQNRAIKISKILRRRKPVIPIFRDSDSELKKYKQDLNEDDWCRVQMMVIDMVENKVWY